MSNLFTTVLTEIFVRGAEVRIDSEADERVLLGLAQGGDDDAVIDLIYAYGPALRGAVGQFRHLTDNGRNFHATENLRQSAIVGFLSAIKAFDPEKHNRLAAIVSQYVIREIGETQDATSAIAIPHASRTRFYRILREANGDVIAAAALAPKQGMRVSTFMAALQAVRSTGVALSYQSDEDPDEALARLAEASPVWDVAQTDIEDRALCDMVFALADDENDLDLREVTAIRHAYGFESYGEPKTDEAVGAALHVSRATAGRARLAGLTKARARLGA